MANRRSNPFAGVVLAATSVALVLVAALLAPARGGGGGVVVVATVSPLSPSPSEVPSPRTSGNQPPVAAGAVAEVQAGGAPLVVDLATLASDAETETSKLRFRLVDPPPRLGTAELRGSVVTYVAREGVEGRDAFSYVVIDRGGPDACFQREPDCAPPREARATVTITIRDDALGAAGRTGPTAAPGSGDTSDGRSPIAWVLIAVGALALALLAVLLLRKTLRRRPTATIEIGEKPQPPPPVTRGLDGLMDLHLGNEPGPPLWAAGDATRKVSGELGEERASPFLATAFWRALRDTSAFFGALDYAGASPETFERPETLLVPHAGGTRYDLVVFDAARRAPEPSVAVVAPSPEELALAWERIAERYAPREGPLRRLPPLLVEAALGEVADVTEFGIVVVPQPEMVLTGCPSPAWAVGCAGDEPTSTAGVAARDSEGRTGVTVAAHAVDGCDQVVVNGRRGKVVSTRPVQDSCFVEVDLDPLEMSGRALAPLRGVSPRQNEHAEFDGLQSGRTSARVSGWDPTILTVEPYVQNKITTDAVTMPGDSGAALVGSDGSVLGFSFYVTGMSYAWPFSCWIWAESVFLAHGLEPLKEG
jgi:hypothetical protein